MRPDIYELLASQQASSTTVTQLNTATKATYIDRSNVEFWAGMITVGRMMRESRTNTGGLPIPETSAIDVLSIADGATEKFGDTLGDTEIYLVHNVDLDNCSVGYFDDTNVSPITPNGDGQIQLPLYVTKLTYLIFSNASGSAQTPSLTYSKVSL